MKDKNKRKNLVKGFSLIEMLVVMLVFTILGVIITQSLSSTLRGSKKSEAISEVKSNIDYAMSVMERGLRNAKAITCTGLTDTLTYTDQFGNTVEYSCEVVGTDSYIASNSARLTSQNVMITNPSCEIFECISGTPGQPDSVELDISASHKNFVGSEGSRVTSQTKILLRNY